MTEDNSDNSSAPIAERTRLHITPFTSDLFNKFIRPALEPSATNISYHTLDTFPEKPFGFVDLPIMEAQKLKKKFNGTILKGTKVRVEDARPQKKRKLDTEKIVDEEVNAPPMHKRKVRKEKREIVGVALPEGRRVKRGWTEPVPETKPDEEDTKKSRCKIWDDSKKREVSKYTDKPECLFKTEIPPNVASNADKKKKRKRDQSGETEIIVHEFEQTRKQMSFLKTTKVENGTKISSEYVDGKGWVSGDGTVLEAETDVQREKRERKERRKAQKAEKLKQEVEAAKESTVPLIPEAVEKIHKRERRSDRTHKDADPVLKAKNSIMTLAEKDKDNNHDNDSKREEKPTSISHIPGTNIPNTTPSSTKAIHPLESLFKQSHTNPDNATPTRPAPIQTSFSLFGGNDEEASTSDTMEGVPQTPFTEGDTAWRDVRSAAPTPDTAAINPKFSFSMPRIDEDEDSAENVAEDDRKEEGLNSNMSHSALALSHGLGITDGTGYDDEGEKEESEFSKWFWENRGDTNRAWKRRRREAMKLKRKRENRRLSRRVV